MYEHEHISTIFTENTKNTVQKGRGVVTVTDSSHMRWSSHDFLRNMEHHNSRRKSFRTCVRSIEHKRVSLWHGNVHDILDTCEALGARRSCVNSYRST